jgi:hypothetical protein
MLGLPVGLIAFDPGVAWAANTAFAAGDFITDPNGNIQLVSVAGTSGASQPATWNTKYGGPTTDNSITWINNGLAWKPLFVDCSAVVRGGGLPRRRYVLPSQPLPLMRWQSNTNFIAGEFIIDENQNVQLVQTGGTSGGPPPNWKTSFGQPPPMEPSSGSKTALQAGSRTRTSPPVNSSSTQTETCSMFSPPESQATLSRYGMASICPPQTAQ